MPTAQASLRALSWNGALGPQSASATTQPNLASDQDRIADAAALGISAKSQQEASRLRFKVPQRPPTEAPKGKSPTGTRRARNDCPVHTLNEIPADLSREASY